MSRVLILVLCIAAISCARGYKDDVGRNSPEEVGLGDAALGLQNQSEKLQDEYRESAALREFSSRAGTFHNSCRRFGCRSIEGRAAFDRLYFQAGEVDKELQQNPNEHLQYYWNQLRNEHLLPMAKKLGYRPGEQ